MLTSMNEISKSNENIINSVNEINHRIENFKNVIVNISEKTNSTEKVLGDFEKKIDELFKDTKTFKDSLALKAQRDDLQNFIKMLEGYSTKGDIENINLKLQM